VNSLTLGIASRVHADTPSHSEGRDRLKLRRGSACVHRTSARRAGIENPLVLELINERKRCAEDFSKR
jgi:hypothetical protein